MLLSLLRILPAWIWVTLLQPLLILNLSLLLGLCLRSLLLLHPLWWLSLARKSWLRSLLALTLASILLGGWWDWSLIRSSASGELGLLVSGQKQFWLEELPHHQRLLRSRLDLESTWCCGLRHQILPGASLLHSLTGGAAVHQIPQGFPIYLSQFPFRDGSESVLLGSRGGVPGH